MQIQFLFRVGALDVAAILHNEIIVRVPRGSGRLTYNVASLCNIAWGWFCLSSVGEQLIAFSY